MTDVWLIVGLGNPGPRYSDTPHNAGARTVELLASRLGARFTMGKASALVADVRSGEHRLLIARPSTYMNISGEPVGRLARYLKVDGDRTVVVHDDIDLALGQLRIKLGGGNAGHNGLSSIQRHLGTPDFYRIRIGVGRPPAGGQDPADYVLAKPGREAQEAIMNAQERAADAVLALIEDGLERTMNEFNTKS